MEYPSREEFVEQYKQMLTERGCDSEEQFEDIILQIERERDRRKENGKQSTERRQAIKTFYEPLHPHLYKLSESFLHPAFLEIAS